MLENNWVLWIQSLWLDMTTFVFTIAFNLSKKVLHADRMWSAGILAHSRWTADMNALILWYFLVLILASKISKEEESISSASWEFAIHFVEKIRIWKRFFSHLCFCALCGTMLSPVETATVCGQNVCMLNTSIHFLRPFCDKNPHSNFGQRPKMEWRAAFGASLRFKSKISVIFVFRWPYNGPNFSLASFPSKLDHYFCWQIANLQMGALDSTRFSEIDHIRPSEENFYSFGSNFFLLRWKFMHFLGLVGH